MRGERDKMGYHVVLRVLRPWSEVQQYNASTAVDIPVLLCHVHVLSYRHLMYIGLVRT